MFEPQQDHFPRPLRVLVVEDNDDDAVLLVAALRADGLTINVQCVDTEATFREALHWDPHLILTDYRMPGFNALSVIRMARERSPSPPVVLVSGAIGEELATEAIKQGAVDFLFKDRLGRLGAAVRTAIAVQQLTAERTRLEEERAHLASIVESAEDGILSCTLDGIITSWNPGAAKLYGYRADEAIGQSVTILRPPELADDIAALMVGVRQGQSIEGHETVRLAKGGRRIRVSLSISPLRDVTGSIVGSASITHDLTALRTTEDALRESEARFRGVWEHTRDAMSLSDPAGMVMAANPAYVELYGFSPERIIGQPFSIIFPEAERAVAEAGYHALFADPSPLPGSFESTIRRADGVTREVEARASFIEVDGERQAIISAIRDVTERKELDHDLRRALDAAHAATRSKSQFLAMMSHELRTPLQAVLGYTDLLLLGAEDTLAPEQREDLGAIHSGATRMVNLIDQLLNLSRLEAGRLDLAQELVDLPEIIEAVRQDIAPQARAKGLALAITLPPVLPLILGDAGRLRQVLLNLAGNAVKFTHEGTVSISVRRSDTGVAIAVRDTGIGITADDMPMIFEEFRQVDGSMTRRYGGAGLGLAIARRLVEQMGGSITVESQSGQGSTFTVRLGADSVVALRGPNRKTVHAAKVVA